MHDVFMVFLDFRTRKELGSSRIEIILERTSTNLFGTRTREGTGFMGSICEKPKSFPVFFFSYFFKFIPSSFYRFYLMFQSHPIDWFLNLRCSFFNSLSSLSTYFFIYFLQFPQSTFPVSTNTLTYIPSQLPNFFQVYNLWSQGLVLQKFSLKFAKVFRRVVLSFLYIVDPLAHAY